MLNYQDLLQLGLSKDKPEVLRRAAALVQQMGFGLVSGVLVRGRFGSPSASLLAISNPPSGYAESMDSASEGARDPLLASLLARPGFVSYDQDFYGRAGAGDLWDAQAPHGFRRGLAVSFLQSSHEEAFMFGVDGVDILPTGAQLLRLQSALQMFALYAQSALVRLARPVPDPAQTWLDKDERLAVQVAGARVFSRRGNLASVRDLGGSALQSGAKKLGGRSITDTVLRAVQAGHIQP